MKNAFAFLAAFAIATVGVANCSGCNSSTATNNSNASNRTNSTEKTNSASSNNQGNASANRTTSQSRNNNQTAETSRATSASRSQQANQPTSRSAGRTVRNSAECAVTTCTTVAQLEALCASGTVLCNFWSPECADCKSMESVITEIAKNCPADTRVCEVNCSEAAFTEYCRTNNITNHPCLVVYKNGKAVSTRTGSCTAEQVREFCRKAS